MNLLFVFFFLYIKTLVEKKNHFATQTAVQQKFESGKIDRSHPRVVIDQNSSVTRSDYVPNPLKNSISYR